MAHHDGSIRERVIALAEEGELSARTAGEMYGVSTCTVRTWLHKCRRDEQSWKAQRNGVMARIQKS